MYYDQSLTVSILYWCHITPNSYGSWSKDIFFNFSWNAILKPIVANMSMSISRDAQIFLDKINK